MVTQFIACEQAHLRVMRTSDKDQSDPVGRSLVSLFELSAPLDFALVATPRKLVLQCKPAFRLCS